MTSQPLSSEYKSDSVALGILLMIGFCFLAPLLDVFAKLASEKVSVGQITTVRFVGQACIMAFIMLLLRKPILVGSQYLFPLFARAIFLIIATYCFFLAIRTMPIADAVAIVFFEPFIILLIGKFYFRDAVGIRRLLASVFGFIGVIFVIKPSFMNFGFVALYPLGTALGFALYIVITRSLSRYLDPIQLQFHTALIGSIICLPLLCIGYALSVPSLDIVMPKGIFWFWLLGVAIFGTISHLFISFALKFASSTTLAPISYIEILSSVFLGFLVFKDLPDPTAVFGMILIVLSGIYVFLRERSLEKFKQSNIN